MTQEENSVDASTPPAGPVYQRWLSSPFWMTLLSGVLLWLAFPPIGLHGLAWIAMVPLAMLVNQKDLGATRPLLKAWLASLIFWLVTFYFIPFPHPILIIGWIALSAYLALYTPLFLVIARTMVSRWRVPLLVAVPVAWTGLEWIRMNFLTGFGMVGLSHCQYPNPLVIQIADLSGAYTVTFAIMAFAAAAAMCLTRSGRVVGVIGCIVIAGLVSGYGLIRLNQMPDNANQNSDVKTIALIQTSNDTILAPKSEPQIMDELRQLRDLNWAAQQSNDSIDLIVWPESSYPYGNFISDDSDDKNVLTSNANLKEMWNELTRRGGDYPGVPTIIGTSTVNLDQQKVFNSAVLIDEAGLRADRYDKVHRVMFGEYVPIVEYYPSLMKYLPIANNLTPGTKPELFKVGSLKVLPNICFETTVPHLIRRQLNSIAANEEEPDVLLNITNDGWFFGTSCLDLHYACNVFRAVELRKPMLVCANTGLSAHIDPWGIARAKGPRRQPKPLICKISPGVETPSSLYRSIGDTLPMILGILCVIALVFNWLSKKRQTSSA